jgi:hypothetical protein
MLAYWWRKADGCGREREDVAYSSSLTGAVVGEGAKWARDTMEREEGWRLQ